MGKCGLDILREFLRLNTTEFANEIGVTRATVWNWKNNKTPISSTHRKCIYKKYNIPKEIDIQKELTKEQTEIIRQCVCHNYYNQIDNDKIAIILQNGDIAIYELKKTIKRVIL